MLTLCALQMLVLLLLLLLLYVATRCQILRLKSTKFDFVWGFAPDPAGGAYSAQLRFNCANNKTEDETEFFITQLTVML